MALPYLPASALAVYVSVMNKIDPEFFDLLVSSYRHFVGAEPKFLAGGDATPEWLYEHAPYCVLAHDAGSVPRFIYANRAAQACFEYDWDEIVGLPSHLSAEPGDRAERQRLLDAVARDGFATGYSGLRIAKSGRRFWIEDGVLWQLLDKDGVVRGQAASFGRWRNASG
jgi:PAS domain-containing protein